MAAMNEASRTTFVPKGADAQVRFLETLHQSCHTYKDRYTRNWESSAKIYRGDNWDSRKDGNPFFKTNLARAKLDRKAAKLTASKPIIGILPRRSGLTQTANVLKRVDSALWDSLMIQMRLEQLSAFARPFGCGFMKTVWNPLARGGLGDVVCAEIDPRCVDLDPYLLRSYDLDRSLVIIHESSVPMTWVKQMSPKHWREVSDFTAPPPAMSDRAQTGSTRPSSAGELKTAYSQYLVGTRGISKSAGLTPIPYVRVREFWYCDPRQEDGEDVYPNGRVSYVVGSGNKAVIINPEVEASRNPFFDGMWPFDMYSARPDLEHPWGESQVEDIRRLEEAINRAGHMSLRHLVKNIDLMVADAGALGADYIKRLSDAGWMILNKMRGLDVTPVRADNAIGDAINLINTILPLMDQQIGIGGDSPVSGRGRVELRSPDLLFGLQMDQNDVLNLEARNLESFLERVGTKINSRVFQFYRTDRFIPYLNGNKWDAYLFEAKKFREEINAMAVQSVASKLIADEEEDDDSKRSKKKSANLDTIKTAIQEAQRGAWKEFDFKIVPLSSLATTKAARAKAMNDLAQEGAVPMSLVLEEAGFDNWEDLQQQAIDEKLKIAQMYQAAGLEPPQPPGSGQKKSSSKK